MLAEMTRLIAVFGDVKDRTAATLDLMFDEWFNVLKRYNSDVLHLAVTNAIEVRRYWPPLADIASGCLAIVTEKADEAARVVQGRAMDKVRQDAIDAASDPYNKFCIEALQFIKRDSQTFTDFRNAGVRTIDGETGLYFENEISTARIKSLYELELRRRFPAIKIAVAPPAKAWVNHLWAKDKQFIEPRRNPAR